MDRKRIVLVDTSALVYWVEDSGERGRAVARFADEAIGSGVALVASAVTWTEALARPLRAGNDALADRYRILLSDSTRIRIEPVDVAVAEEAARLRAVRGLPLADATQIATARAIGATEALTNDESWRRVPECPTVILVDELAFDL